MLSSSGASSSSNHRDMLSSGVFSKLSVIAEKSKESADSTSTEDLLRDMESDFGTGPEASSVNASHGVTPTSSHNQGKLYTAKMCFLLDVTGSMQPQRDAVILKIFDIVDRSCEKFPEVKIEVACVGYRDVDVSDSRRYEVIPFTSDTEEFCTRLAGMTCGGGGDEAEDVLGGMDVALKQLDWSGGKIKVMFHIGDSPHHGPIFHDTCGCNDSHPNLVQTPRPYTEILADYADNHIDYNFGLVKNPRGNITTREMARLFAQSYNSYQSKKSEFGLMDLSDFSPDELFDKVLTGLTGSICSFMAGRRR